MKDIEDDFMRDSDFDAIEVVRFSAMFPALKSALEAVHIKKFGNDSLVKAKHKNRIEKIERLK